MTEDQKQTSALDCVGEFMDLGRDLNFYVEREKSMLEKMQSSSLFAEETIKSADFATIQAKQQLKPFWMNSEPLLAAYVDGKGESFLFQLSERFKGKVLLFNFWNSTSPQSLDTLDKTKALLLKYQSAGLELIGVHNSVFDFAARPEILADIVYHSGVTYPVVNDHDFAIWRAFQLRYWPTRVLVSADFKVLYTQVGDEGFDLLEQEVQNALRETFPGLPCPRIPPESREEISHIKTPDLYFSFDQIHQVSMQKFLELGFEQVYPALTESVPEGKVGFCGAWTSTATGVDFSNDAYSKGKFTGSSQLKFRCRASSIYLIAGSKNYERGGVMAQALVEVLLDGKPLRPEVRGNVCKLGAGRKTILEVTTPKMHQLAANLSMNESHEIEIVVEQAYAGNLEIMGVVFSAR